jgi:hypothetical protein
MSAVVMEYMLLTPAIFVFTTASPSRFTCGPLPIGSISSLKSHTNAVLVRRLLNKASKIQTAKITINYVQIGFDSEPICKSFLTKNKWDVFVGARPA